MNWHDREIRKNMDLKLYRQNRIYEGIQRPALGQLLDSRQPFVISSPEKRRHLRDDIVFSDYYLGPVFLLGGILVIDYDRGRRCFVKEGDKKFEEQEGTGRPWHSDKFRIRANGYELIGDFVELRKEFEKLGFCF